MTSLTENTYRFLLLLTITMMVTLVCMHVEGAGGCKRAVMVAGFTTVLSAHFKDLNFLADASHHLLNGPSRFRVVTCHVPCGLNWQFAKN